MLFCQVFNETGGLSESGLLCLRKPSMQAMSAIRALLNSPEAAFVVVENFPLHGGPRDAGTGLGGLPNETQVKTQPVGLSPPAAFPNQDYDLKSIEHLKSSHLGDKEPAYVAAHLNLVGPEAHAHKYKGRKLHD